MSMQQTATDRIAFIGGGNMARALIAGLIRHAVPPHRLSVGEPDAQSRAALQRDFGVAVSADNATAIGGAALIVLAVKPQQAAGVLRELRAALQTLRPLLLSIAAGLRIADLGAACPTGTALARAMPNRPALVGAGITGLYAAPTVTTRQRQLAELVGTASGRAVWLRSEAELDVVTALSGSGPAYFFLLAERMADAAERLGLERDTALLLAGATLHGSGLLANEVAGLAEQRAAVTSKGGTTEAALRVLDQGGFDGLIARAIEAGTARSIELAGLLSSSLQAEHP
jgi:pyrroline-5-carboxylate reductase